MFIHSTILYEPNVYDCSDMCYDQHRVFEKIGIDTDYAISFERQHMWLILDIFGHDVHWESVTLVPTLP